MHAVCKHNSAVLRAYFAVVSSTNRLTRLFSRVLKYCGERKEFQLGNVIIPDIKPAQRKTASKSPNISKSNKLWCRLQTQHTGSEVFGEKRQKPERRQQDSQTRSNRKTVHSI